MLDLKHDWRYNYKFPTDIMRLKSHLLKIGYVTVHRVKTLGCTHCVELMLIWARCPAGYHYIGEVKKT